MKTKLIPFDIEKAKAGAKIVTRCGYSAEVKFHNVKVFPPIICLVEMEGPYAYTLDGKYTESNEDSDMDLFIEEEVENDSNNQDETIRKALISYFQSFPYNSLEDAGINAKDAIAWLEKQGEQETLCAKCKKSQPSHSCQDITALGRCAVEHEQKPADNKPRFQEGDWVIDGLGIVHQIIRVVENLGSHTYGYDTDDGFYIHDSESGVRLWNITDAKDGDVLMKGEVIFIFNKMLGEWIYCHSSISYKDGSSINLNNCGLINNEVYPATKEQRDFLFQKMKEAGYEWDPVKKELRKIESEEKKELKKVKPKFQKGNWVIDKQGTVHQIANVIENVTNHTYGYDVVGGGYFNENVEGIRFWTIQDARNGIVLACDTCIVLFKEIDGLNIKCHCTYHFMDTPMFFVDTLQNKTAFYPATKEQRDLLFQKIKEEGYQWDSERKELKKIKYKDDMAEKEVKQKSSFNEFGFRRMTNQELSWWLRDHPEECREFKYEGGGDYVYSSYDYTINQANTQVWGKLIRRNGGEWQEPLVEI